MAARVRDEVVTADERSDGMFPLITNGTELPLRRILEAYKFQPKLEKRRALVQLLRGTSGPRALRRKGRLVRLPTALFKASR